MKVQIVYQLFQHKVGDIGARDFEFGCPVSAWKAVLVIAGAIAIYEGSWTEIMRYQRAYFLTQLLFQLR